MSNAKISLREAVRKHSVIKSDIIKCKCKSGCKTTHCICKRNNKMCLSHCHKGLKCSNGDEFDVYENFKKMFPKWGDKHTSNENDVLFSNMCTVDNWLALVYIIANSRPQLFIGIIGKCFDESSDLMAILDLARKCDYGMAKFELARLNNLIYTEKHLVFMEMSNLHLPNIWKYLQSIQ